jgi:hypothetical protein
MQRGRYDPLYPFHATPEQWVAVKGKIAFFGHWTFTQFAHCWASWLMGTVAQCRGVIYKHFADVEDTEKHPHVPAMSSEAPSTSNGVTGTWKRFSASSTSVTWAWGSWEDGVVIIWRVWGGARVHSAGVGVARV